jgi:hypothetical protein
VRVRLSASLVAAAVLVLAGCGAAGKKKDAEVDVDPPRRGACRVLEPSDIAAASNDTATVGCAKPHTAETFLVGTFTGKAAQAAVDDPALGAEVYRACGKEFRRFTGADESLTLRSLIGWAWFRPTDDAWAEGARWYRCDVVGGTEDSPELITLPKTAAGVLLGRPGDRWMACVAGDTVTGAPQLPCSEKHAWRAVTTIVVGQPKDDYPGDRVVEVLSRDYCSDSVGAWMNYPVDYEFAYTWFHEAEWKAGNRRSVCWARTAQ